MLKKYLAFDKNIFLPSVLLAVLAVTVVPFQIYFLSFLLFASLTVRFGEKFLLGFVIFSYLTIPSDLNDTMRLLLNILNFLILGYLFIKKFGFDFKNYPYVPRLPSFVILFTFLIMIISTLLSASVFTGMIEVARTAVFILILYWLFSFISDDKSIFSFINALLISALVISVSLFYEFFKTDKFLFLLGSMGYVTLGGYFTNSTAVGGFLAVTASLTFLYLFMKDKKKYRPGIALLFLLQVLALLLTNARAAIAAAFVSIMFILFFTNRKAFKRILIAVIVVVPVLFIIPYISSIMDNFFRVDRILENTRYYLWDMAWGMIKDNPIFGVGPGMFNHYMYTYLPVAMGSWTEREIYVLQQIAASPAHNFFLMRASEEGILGLISAIGIFFAFFRYGFDLIKKNKTGNNNYFLISVGITAIGSGLFVRSFFEATGIFTNGWITRDLPFWLLFSILVYIKLKTTDLLEDPRLKKTVQ